MVSLPTPLNLKGLGRKFHQPLKMICFQLVGEEGRKRGGGGRATVVTVNILQESKMSH